ncbi:MAG: hypothetical protein J5688_06780 [Paludibacteraceae bacterium]|nr:hypothetical protein [Paludibacteraceae bacterium]
MRKILILAIAGVAACGSLAALTGCNVTRTVTTSSSYLQRGDTTVLIQSKTIESYDASKRL